MSGVFSHLVFVNFRGWNALGVKESAEEEKARSKLLGDKISWSRLHELAMWQE